MADRFVSPAVFVEEKDLSFLPQGIAEIGAAFIGPTSKGPAFKPTIVESQNDFTAKFGLGTSDYYTPYAVKAYLKEAARATVVRVLGLDGYDNSSVKSLILSVTGSGGTYPVGLIHPTQNGITLTTGSIGGAAKPTEFSLTISGSNGSTTFTSMSLVSTDTNYFSKVLGVSPKGTYDGYSYVALPGALAFISGAAAGSGSVIVAVTTTQLMLSGSTYGAYSNAHTPIIRSQLFGSTRYNLFTVRTLSDGNAANADVKISIVSINPNSDSTKRGTFGIIVREFSDTDGKPSILEQFDNLTLDPDDTNYVGRRVGTSHPVIDSDNSIYLEGEFPNNSKYIYVDMDDAIEGIPVAALPYGFAPLAAPINTSPIPAPAYVVTRYSNVNGSVISNNKVYYGFDFDDSTGQAYLNPTPSGSVNSSGTTLIVGTFPSGSTSYVSGGADPGFDLLTMLSGSDATDISPASAITLRKFSVPFQGGFDGQNPAVIKATGGNIVSTNLMGFDLSTADKSGAKSYKLAIDVLDNPDEFDINMLVIPGALYSQHSYVVNEALTMCENRGDCFYIMDPDTLSATVNTVVNTVDSLDSNYAAVYYPWVKILDTDNNKTVWVPPSVVMPAVYAFSDRTAAEWYAPAGLNRGGLAEALQVRKRLDQADRDELYEGRVNPIAQFPAQGIVVWGQKTLQEQASALDRVNVRRLLIAVKKFFASTARYLIFEQNVEATRQRFLSIVNPYLANVQERAGLYAFKVVMDSTNNTPDLIDRNILVGDIYLQPAKSIEYIKLSFNILPSGATFSE